jgi:hypothetical protein
MDAGNTLGAIVFLAAGTWLGWKVVSGQAQAFLAAMASGKGGGGPGAFTPAVVQHGQLAGVNLTPPKVDPTKPYTAPDPYVIPNTTPNVFGDVFGQSGPLESTQYESPYGSAAPFDYQGIPPDLYNWLFPR